MGVTCSSVSLVWFSSLCRRLSDGLRQGHNAPHAPLRRKVCSLSYLVRCHFLEAREPRAHALGDRGPARWLVLALPGGESGIQLLCEVEQVAVLRREVDEGGGGGAIGAGMRALWP